MAPNSKSNNAEIAVLQEQMDQVSKTVDRIEALLQEQNKVFTPLEIFRTFEAEVMRQLKSVKRTNWVTHTLTAGLGIIFGAIITAMAYALIVGRSH